MEKAPSRPAAARGEPRGGADVRSQPWRDGRLSTTDKQILQRIEVDDIQSFAQEDVFVHGVQVLVGGLKDLEAPASVKVMLLCCTCFWVRFGLHNHLCFGPHVS